MEDHATIKSNTQILQYYDHVAWGSWEAVAYLLDNNHLQNDYLLHITDLIYYFLTQNKNCLLVYKVCSNSSSHILFYYDLLSIITSPDVEKDHAIPPFGNLRNVTPFPIFVFVFVFKCVFTALFFYYHQ